MQICFLNRRGLSIRTLTSKINSLIPIEKSASFQFQSDTVQNKLLSHYGSNLVPRRGQGMSNIIISSRVTIDDVVIVAEELPTTDTLVRVMQWACLALTCLVASDFLIVAMNGPKNICPMRSYEYFS